MDPAPQRILFATTGIFGGGGIASVNRCIVRALEEARVAGTLAGLDTLSFTPETSRELPSAAGEHRIVGDRLRFVWHLWRMLRAGRPDLVLFDHAGLSRFMGLPLPGVRGVRYAIFAHGGELAVVTQGARRAVFEGASQILTNSEFTARQVRARYPALAERVDAVPLCIDPAKLERWGREADGAPEREPVVLIVGRLWAEERGKGHDALIAALPRVREAVPDARLWIVGTGDDRPRLEHSVRERGLGDAVRFFGAISDTELGRLYRSAGVFAMPSRQEGFGLVYAEAMWHGLPCIGSTADAAAEVIADGETGVLVPYDAPEPLAEAIVALIADAGGGDRMSEAAAGEARRRFAYPRFRDDLLRSLGVERPGS
jgi:phosphatidylinositol alpha-1,6-mannosyltransferase